MNEDRDALRLPGGEAAKGEAVAADLLAAFAVLDPVAAALPGNPALDSSQRADWLETRFPAENAESAPFESPSLFHSVESARPAATEAPSLRPVHLPEDSHDSRPLLAGQTSPFDSIGGVQTFTIVGGSRAEPVGMASALGGAGSGGDAPPAAISGNVSKGTVTGTGWESVYIDTLISGVKLDATGPIHYYLAGQSDLATFKGEYGGNPTLFNWTASEKSAAEQMFQLYENVTALQFVETTDYNDADIVWWQSNAAFFTRLFGQSGYVGFNEFPDAGTVLPLYGVFDHNYFEDTMFQGGDGFLVMMHELGHGLGLAHPHDGYNGDEHFPGVNTSANEGTYQLNQQIWTEMSYNRGWDSAPWTMNYGGAGTPMTLDIAALQDIYGANTSFANGDNTYALPTVNAKGTFFSAIWDTGGADTIDGSAAKNTVVIDLRPAPLDGPDAGGYVSWQKTIGGGFTIANDVVIENAKGGLGADTLNGNDAANTLIGNGGNDTLDSGGLDGIRIADGGNDDGKVDDLQGGAGSDTYFLGAGDTVTENPDEGNTDTVKSLADVDLENGAGFTGQEIENVTLLGAAVSATGNTRNNAITGNDQDNILDGGGGNDTLNGGKGSDTYIVDSTADKVVESSGGLAGGTDTVKSAVTFSLGALGNVENLTLTGTDAIYGTGNGLANVLTGNGNDNLLDGGGNTDTFDGGAGNDTYVLDTLAELGQITDAAGAADTIKASVLIAAAVADIENYFNTGTAAWTLDLSGRGNEDNRLTGGSAVDTLIGGDGDDVLDGGKGADKLNGGSGFDTYTVDNAKDQITDSDGGNALLINRTVNLVKDTAFAGIIAEVTLTGTGAINVTGDAGANLLIGNAGKNLLDGGGLGGISLVNGGTDDGQVDDLRGGAGNDTYYVGAGDTVTETAAQGIDTLYTLSSVDLTNDAAFTGQEIENVVLLSGAADAAGNGLNNALTGNDGGNILDGGAGNDTLTGGKGGDTYIVDSTGDKVVETLTLAKGGGTDTVESSVTFSLAKLANIDDLTLTGSDDIDGTGNGLVNHLKGNSGDNRLDGGKGSDIFDGGDGNDTYLLDSLAEAGTITDSSGSDTVKSTVLVAAPISGIENYVYTGSKAWAFDISADSANSHHLIGGSGADTLRTSDADDILEGGKGNDSLTGGQGDDTLTGGLGADTFRYEVFADRGTGNETITDFKLGKNGDILDIHDLLLAVGTDAGHAVGDGFLQFVDDGFGNTRVEIDQDGGGDGYAALVTVVGVQLDQTDMVNLKL